MAEEIVEQCRNAGREFKGNLTELPEVDWEEEVRKIPVGLELQERIKEKLRQYVGGMGRNIISNS